MQAIGNGAIPLMFGSVGRRGGDGGIVGSSGALATRSRSIASGSAACWSAGGSECNWWKWSGGQLPQSSVEAVKHRWLVQVESQPAVSPRTYRSGWT
jgi:hypothetical protein